MKYKTLFFIAFLFTGLMMFQSCNSNPPGATKTVKIEGNKFKGESFGAGITATSYKEYGEVITALEKSKEVNATFKAIVNEVCQTKGCWMTLSVKNQPEMMVQFQDYGFFMPKGISGKEVLVQGKAFKEITPVDELRHMAEDAGKSKEDIAAITKPKEELKVLATGVLLLN